MGQEKATDEINDDDDDDDDDDDNSITPRPRSPKQSMLIMNDKKKKQEQQSASKEINQLSAETTWRRIQAEKEREKDKIQRCYNKRALIHEQMIQVRKLSGQKEIKHIRVRKINTNKNYYGMVTMMMIVIDTIIHLLSTFSCKKKLKASKSK